MINALAQMPGVTLKVAGVADEPDAMVYFQNEIQKHGLESRVEFLGRVSDEQLLELYAKSMGVFYAPFNEDYGYVTLEAMASRKPIVTAKDSGGTLEFVRHEENGFVADPTPHSIAEAFNRIKADPAFAQRIGAAGRAYIEQSGMLRTGWDQVIEGLLSPLRGEEMRCVVGA
jgi:glycosyltransferase involved in cell wall biosynthesis